MTDGQDPSLTATATGQHRVDVDLLHPLTELHWEQCHTWNNVWPRHCAVLQDRVAILSWSYKTCDLLHISTDLRSWSIMTLPYQDMSLTTYQSKFVAVGGRHLSTRELTNLLFSSDTGLQWEEILPAMPTKRRCTSSVSTQSPNHLLVVAGGTGSDDWDLDVVELLTDNKWFTLDALPKPCSKMHSTFHDGYLYFVGGWGQHDVIYTCNSSTLISVCGDKKNYHRPIWSQLKAPGDFTIAVSYSSYLVSINGGCDVRAYSSVTQSWVMATNAEELHHEHTVNIDAAVLSTGEIIYAHSYGGVYRVNMKVSSFDPDSRFISNVLFRLEAVMGVCFVSVLADIPQQLRIYSGIKLQPRRNSQGCQILLPDPRTAPCQYVNEVMLQWSAACNPLRQPTWKELLLVLEEIGQVQLGQQIEAFMKERSMVVMDYVKNGSIRSSKCDKHQSLQSSPNEENVALFKKYIPNLIDAIYPYIASVGDHCYGKNLISDDTYEHLQLLAVTDKNKARKLLINVKEVILKDTLALQTFFDVLNEFPDCANVITRMKRDLGH